MTDFSELLPQELKARALVFAFQTAAASRQPVTAASLIADAEEFLAFIEGAK